MGSPGLASVYLSCPAGSILTIPDLHVLGLSSGLSVLCSHVGCVISSTSEPSLCFVVAVSAFGMCVFCVCPSSFLPSFDLLLGGAFFNCIKDVGFVLIGGGCLVFFRDFYG